MSYWFPKLLAAGLPVPRTEIVHMPDEMRSTIFSVFDGKPLPKETQPFFAELRAAIDRIGSPCFFRTGQTSGKHDWKRTCYVADPAAIEQHVLALVEFSECAGFMGLPWDVWCVREMLPTKPVMIADRYGDMPVCREFRYFVRDGKVICSHPYWPLQALVEGTDNCPSNLRRLYEAISEPPGLLFFMREEPEPSPSLEELAATAGKTVGGDWSVDILETERGWFVTDMAIAQNSYHWDGCDKAACFAKAERNGK